MLLLEADGRGRHASVGVAIGGIAMPSSRLAAEPRGTSKDTDDDAVSSNAASADTLCFPCPAVVALPDLVKLCLKKLDKGCEAPPDDEDNPAGVLVDEACVFLNTPSLVLAALAAAAAEVL